MTVSFSSGLIIGVMVCTEIGWGLVKERGVGVRAPTAALLGPGIPGKKKLSIVTSSVERRKKG